MKKTLLLVTILFSLKMVSQNEAKLNLITTAKIDSIKSDGFFIDSVGTHNGNAMHQSRPLDAVKDITRYAKITSKNLNLQISFFGCALPNTWYFYTDGITKKEGNKTYIVIKLAIKQNGKCITLTNKKLNCNLSKLKVSHVRLYGYSPLLKIE